MHSCSLTAFVVNDIKRPQHSERLCGPNAGAIQGARSGVDSLWVGEGESHEIVQSDSAAPHPIHSRLPHRMRECLTGHSNYSSRR
jgi:hypothetical protein